MPHLLDCRRCSDSNGQQKDSLRLQAVRLVFHDIRSCLSASNRVVDPEQRCFASSWLREHQDVELFEKDLEAIFALEPPPVGERAEKLLKGLAIECGSIDAPFGLLFAGDGNQDLQAISWSANSAELRYLLDEYAVAEKKWVRDTLVGGNHRYLITAKGYDHLDSLRRTLVDSAQGFCAMWFDKEVAALWTAIEPAIAAAGYKPARIDKVEHANRIDDEIMAQIRRSKFVVADFTGQRGGVYFEAGFALGLGRPVIWTVRSDALGAVHFDNRQYNFLVWEPEELGALQTALTARIVALLGEGPLPIPR